jgi:hypothetical protein
MVLWATGTQVSLITNLFAKEVRFQGHPATIQISGAAQEAKISQTYSKVLLRKIDGTEAEFNTYAIEKITGDAISRDISKAKKTFPALAGDLESPGGPIDLLIGMDHTDDAPREHERGAALVLYKFVFGTRNVVCSNINGSRTKGSTWKWNVKTKEPSS